MESASRLLGSKFVQDHAKFLRPPAQTQSTWFQMPKMPKMPDTQFMIDCFTNLIVVIGIVAWIWNMVICLQQSSTQTKIRSSVMLTVALCSAFTLVTLMFFFTDRTMSTQNMVLYARLKDAIRNRIRQLKKISARIIYMMMSDELARQEYAMLVIGFAACICLLKYLWILLVCPF